MLQLDNPVLDTSSYILKAKLRFRRFLAVFNMGGNPGAMMPMQQQQHGTQGAFGNMAPNAQSLQSGMATLQSNPQSHPNFAQQRQQNQQ